MSAGYLSLGFTAWVTGYIASVYALRPQPFYLGTSFGLGVSAIGTIKAVYLAVWGFLQLVTGPLSDRLGRKWLIAAGMIVQAVGIWLTVQVTNYRGWMTGALLQGIGTAMVYPTLLAAISDVAHPEWRASAMGVYRFWRDIGYAIGALLSGVVADLLGNWQRLRSRLNMLPSWIRTITNL